MEQQAVNRSSNINKYNALYVHRFVLLCTDSVNIQFGIEFGRRLELSQYVRMHSSAYVNTARLCAWCTFLVSGNASQSWMCALEGVYHSSH